MKEEIRSKTHAWFISFKFTYSFDLITVAAEDVGLNVSDLDNVHTFTRYTTCISEDKGGSGNPSVATGKGEYLN